VTLTLGRTAVYRLYAADDTHLYVGIAKSFGRRWEQHARLQPWWGHVDHQSVYWYPSREEARLVEKRAMEEERPVYNKQGSPWVGGVLDDGTGFWVLPRPKKVPRPRDPNAVVDETPIQRFRMPLDAWTAFGRMCKRLGVPRAQRLYELMWDEVRQYGTEAENAAFAAADEQMRARRSRRLAR
jgi:predicted GIY-YIG superfamily endonuclease